MRGWECEGLGQRGWGGDGEAGDVGGWGCGRVGTCERLGTWKAAGVGGCLLTQKAPLYLVCVCGGGGGVGGGLCLSSQSRWGEPVDRGKEEGDVCR